MDMLPEESVGDLFWFQKGAEPTAKKKMAGKLPQ
jgi:hypothetical protein